MEDLSVLLLPHPGHQFLPPVDRSMLHLLPPAHPLSEHPLLDRRFAHRYSQPFSARRYNNSSP
jgi:hypothetical protein